MEKLLFKLNLQLFAKDKSEDENQQGKVISSEEKVKGEETETDKEIKRLSEENKDLTAKVEELVTSVNGLKSDLEKTKGSLDSANAEIEKTKEAYKSVFTSSDTNAHDNEDKKGDKPFDLLEAITITTLK